MLAYELYYENEKSGTVSGSGNPIKKIFVDENQNVTIDGSEIDKMGKINTPDPLKNFLQNFFDMPIDTTPKINLPNKLVASRAPDPYVKIPGYLKIESSKRQKPNEPEIKGEITLGKKKTKPFARLSMPSYEREMPDEGDMALNLNKKDYTINGVALYDIYNDNKIIQNDKLCLSLFKKIASEFFDFIESKQIEFVKGKSNFALYILPNNNEIEFVSKNQDGSGSNSIDSFGNSGTWPESRSSGAYFLSFNDKAFTINCKEKENFYEDLGINSTSLSKIILPENKAMYISGFLWYFTDLKNPNVVFHKRSKGIYDQLFNNYSELKGNQPEGETLNKSSYHKIFCIKKTNAKLEVMIDENFTMQRLSTIFKNIKSKEDIPPMALESLIIKRHKSTIYTHYIQAIKSILNQTRFDADQINNILTLQVRNKIGDWLTEKSDKNANEFFSQSEFCRNVLILSLTSKTVDEEEQFAKSVGHMARLYVDFRKETKNDNNSLKDLLAKPKYDIATLKFVVKSICRGLHLINVEDEKYGEIIDKIQGKVPTKDVADSNKDLSYYFYMGYFRRD